MNEKLKPYAVLRRPRLLPYFSWTMKMKPPILPLLLALLLLHSGTQALLLAQASPTDYRWDWAQSISSDSLDRPPLMMPDGEGGVLMAGEFRSEYLNLCGTVLRNGTVLSQNTLYLHPTAYLARLSPTGTLLWHCTLNAYRADVVVTDFAPDGLGNTYAVGYFTGRELNFGSGILPNTGYTLNPASSQAMVVKIDAEGKIRWAQTAGGEQDDRAEQVAVDGAGNVWMLYKGMDEPTAAPKKFRLNLDMGAGRDLRQGRYLCKYDPSGKLLLAKRLGDRTTPQVEEMRCAKDGRLYLCGNYVGQPLSGGYFLEFSWELSVIKPNPELNFWVMGLDAQGIPLWVKSGDSPADVAVTAMATDEDGNCYLAGVWNYNLAGYLQYDGLRLESNNGENLFILAIGHDGEARWAKSMGSWQCNVFPLRFSQDPNTAEVSLTNNIGSGPCNSIYEMFLDDEKNLQTFGRHGERAQWEDTELLYPGLHLATYSLDGDFLALLDLYESRDFREDMLLNITGVCTTSSSGCFVGGSFKRNFVMVGNHRVNHSTPLGTGDLFIAYLNR